MNLPRESNLPQLTSTYLQAKVEMLSMHTFFHDGTKVKTTFENKPPLLMFKLRKKENQQKFRH